MRSPRAPMPPGFVRPMKPVLVDCAPDGADWLHEIKFDGYRTQVVATGGAAHAYTSSGLDWSAKYARVVAAAARLPCRSATLDGEMIVQDAQGRSSFSELRRAIGREPHRLIFYAFDLLAIDGQDLRRRPCIERRDRLAALIGPADASSPVQFSTHFVGNGAALFRSADEHGLEGIVSKRPDSVYVSGESDGWLKTKTFAVADFEIVGVETKASGIPVALLAKDGRPIGDAAIAFGGAKRTAFWAIVDHMQTPRARLAGFLKRRQKATWLKAGVSARVRYLRGEEKLRHAVVLDVVSSPKAQG